MEPLRSRDYQPGHRQIKPAKVKVVAGAGGPSPWENRPRDGFTAGMSERVDEMRASKVAHLVKGLPAD
jgi:hypothetical protein